MMDTLTMMDTLMMQQGGGAWRQGRGISWTFGSLRLGVHQNGATEGSKQVLVAELRDAGQEPVYQVL